jgi:hypothetical protein
MKEKYLAIICITIILFSFGLGYVFGIETGIKECITYGVMIAHNFINMTFDNEKMSNMLYTYRGKITATFGGLE